LSYVIKSDQQNEQYFNAVVCYGKFQYSSCTVTITHSISHP